MALDFRIIGERLRQARTDKKITQEQLAEKLDVSTTFLSRIERGTISINLKRLSQICANLEISEGYVLNGTNDDRSSYLNSDFTILLKNCPSDKLNLIYKIAKTIVDN